MNYELKTLTDETLRQLMSDIKGELDKREIKRKKETMQKIRAMADAAGLSVTLKEKGQKRRGRPPKRRQENE